ncbi:HK97 family phage prohead protease [Novosphingopyxis iocasae]|uniref:HK97 family phage prohead protease n=1 Tax=Novosphingopyxis iocasae TaxID=2762729 RepID=UPI00165191E2
MSFCNQTTSVRPELVEGPYCFARQKDGAPTGSARTEEVVPGALRIAGYAAIFGIEDRGGDIIEPGAFAATLAAQPSDGLPLLWQHDPLRRIGTVTYAAEDRKGLRVIAQLTPEGTALARCDWGGGLSFGYRARASVGTRPRRLLALDLVEVSLVRLPMQALARVHRLSG